MTAPLIGIDLGTTHTVVAVFDDDGPRVLADREGQTLLPSVVAVDSTGHLVVGAPALERASHTTEHVAARFKPDMGKDKRLNLAGSELGPVALSAAVLREIVAVAEESLGQSVREAVITVPAWFREPQRRATLEAAELAGLAVQRLINEPTAAALAYGLRAGDDPLTAVVMDLGGGTFDVSVLELFDGVVDVRASVGDVHLGGEDFTDALAEHLAGGASGVTPALRTEAERLKRALSTQLAVSRESAAERSRITRPELQRLCKELLQRIQSVTVEALTQASIHPADVDEVLLVGGATRMPMVQDVARELFHKPPTISPDVDHAVALGAAVQAALLADHAAVREKAVADVLTHSLGVSVVRSFGDQQFDDRFAPLLHRGTALPISRVESFSTLHGGQSELRIEVYEGEHRRASENELLGVLSVDGLPTHDDGETTESIQIRFTHDTSGLLEVEVTVDSTGERRQLLIERSGASDPQALAEAAAALNRLKTHPRDLLPNRWLIERGTRLVEMLVGADRELLDAELTQFEAALEHGEPEFMTQAAHSLRRSIEALVRAHGISLD